MLIDRMSFMETFKVVNPGCVFADFVRWCSSEDWKEEMVTGEGNKSINEVGGDVLAM